MGKTLKYTARRSLAKASFLLGSSFFLKHAHSQLAPNGQQDAQLQDLNDDLSRQDLFALIKDATDASTRAEGAVEFALLGPFRFPNDATHDSTKQDAQGKPLPRKDSIFGIDISHHNKAPLPFHLFRARHIRFVYMKASQGINFRDGKFLGYWTELGKLPTHAQVHRGAYHFLSADYTGADQAQNFLKVFNAGGGLRSTDMPPVVDLEWDKASRSSPDRWLDRTAEQIITSVRTWCKIIESATGRKPLIYTAKSWIDSIPGLSARATELSEFNIWIADYSKSARGVEIPKVPIGLGHKLWQFTDSAEMALHYDGRFDCNIFKGSDADFSNVFGVQALGG